MPRYTVDFSKNFDLILTKMAKDESTTKSEIIRRSLAFYKFLRQQVMRNGEYKVSITDQNDKVISDIVMPYWRKI